MSEAPTYSPGLAGVIAGESAISCIDVERNKLNMRGYDLVDLTEGGASFEEVAYLLLHDDLPNAGQSAAFCDALTVERHLPDPVVQMINAAPKSAHPMALLRTAVSSLGYCDIEAEDNSHEANVRKAVRLLAKVPLAIAAGHRNAQGLEPVEPRDDLGLAANLLYMLRGDDPQPYAVDAMNVSLILYSEHGYNASTFAARVAASTLADMHAAITVGVATLGGPLHGGANEAAMEMMLEIGTPDNARAWVMDALESKRKIMGFGHREYKSGDSRVPAMKQAGQLVLEATGEDRWRQIAEIAEETMLSEKGIFPNLDLPCAYTYYGLDIPIPLFTPIFVASRVSGWAAHVIEQQDNNRLIRPNHNYTGPVGRTFKPVDQR
ncbi:MAG TPA: citrate/2-methylcitrate synthase [Candidatus Latescibacteria bacterium]|jgi:citrate synthase|nr:citrate synthase [Gemmatimonadota bacterium]MDP7364519.1 citrate/2-methylcitrate synthase [Candidatus Latescibacterota bacterium]MDP7635777.1 citrate/2-methylcitrate synthase [Candidatus Latescibacterota bacterium]HCV25210.1 citrate synthase [Candidatus Latescibacterota bacterium]HJN28693.1 citrate/2-methylcitrate synthase [Candidatus Latescibacterota bacterium]|tara:strand:+ start:1497 stop:2630 length:1134 start_codon:yes stop_codon:yes gene_type:complete